MMKSKNLWKINQEGNEISSVKNTKIYPVSVFDIDAYH